MMVMVIQVVIKALVMVPLVLMIFDGSVCFAVLLSKAGAQNTSERLLKVI